VSGHDAFFKYTDFVTLSPAQAWVFLDEHEDTIDDGWFWISMDGKGAKTGWLDLPTSRHNGAANLSFADGHAETRKWLDARTLQPVQRKKFTPTRCPNNPDVTWLQEHTSVTNEFYIAR